MNENDSGGTVATVAGPAGPIQAPIPTAVVGTLQGHAGSVMAVRYNRRFAKFMTVMDYMV